MKRRRPSMEDNLKISNGEYLSKHCMDRDLYLEENSERTHRKSRVWLCSAQLVCISLERGFWLRFRFLCVCDLFWFFHLQVWFCSHQVLCIIWGSCITNFCARFGWLVFSAASIPSISLYWIWFLLGFYLSSCTLSLQWHQQLESLPCFFQWCWSCCRVNCEVAIGTVFICLGRGFWLRFQFLCVCVFFWFFHLQVWFCVH